MPASSLSARIAGLLDRPLRGSLVAAFSRSCYIDLAGRIIAVVGPELLDGPLNLVAALPPEATFLDLAAGAAVEVRSRVLDLAGRWQIDTVRTRRWDPRLPPLVPGPELDRRMAQARAALEAWAPPDGFARGERRPGRAAEAMGLLADALRSGDAAVAGRAAHDLAGLGPGLTPSGDDVLAGALLATAVLAPPESAPLRGRIMASARGRTTRISEAYLEAAASGDAGEAWHRLVAGLRGERDGDDEGATGLRAAVRGILAFGETSGADMLTGFLLAAEALPRA